MQAHKFWLVIGSQFLYCPEVLDTVAERGVQMAKELSAAQGIPFDVVYKDTVKPPRV